MPQLLKVEGSTNDRRYLIHETHQTYKQGLPMGHRPTGHAVGRLNLSIDWVEVDRHLEAGCSGAEVASIVGISPDHCSTTFGTY